MDETVELLLSMNEAINYHVVAACLVGVALVLLLYGVGSFLDATRARRGKKPMTQQERDARVKVLVSDAVADAIFELVYKNKITDEDALHYYDLLAKGCDLPDVMPSRTKLVKERIKARSVKYGGQKSINKPVPLPVETVVVPFKRKKNKLEISYHKHA